MLMQFDPGMEYRPGWGDGRYFIVCFENKSSPTMRDRAKTIIQLHSDNNGNRYKLSDFSANLENLHRISC